MNINTLNIYVLKKKQKYKQTKPHIHNKNNHNIRFIYYKIYIEFLVYKMRKTACVIFSRIFTNFILFLFIYMPLQFFF